MKVLVFGNLAAGKSYLSQKICEAIPDIEYLSADCFRKKIGDGTIEKEQLAKQEFLNSIKPDKFQLIESIGLGKTGISIVNILSDTSEIKIIIILKTALEICLQRMEARTWDVPFPASTKYAYHIAEVSNELIATKTIQLLWAEVINCHFFEIEELNDDSILETINLIRKQK